MLKVDLVVLESHHYLGRCPACSSFLCKFLPPPPPFSSIFCPSPLSFFSVCLALSLDIEAMALEMQDSVRGESGPSTQLKARNGTAPTASSSGSSLHLPSNPSLPPRQSADDGVKRKFRSYRLRGSYEKPWLDGAAVKKTKWNNLIVAGLILLGFIGAGVISFFMVMPYRDLPVRQRICLVCLDS